MISEILAFRLWFQTAEERTLRCRVRVVLSVRNKIKVPTLILILYLAGEDLQKYIFSQPSRIRKTIERFEKKKIISSD